MQTCLTDLDVEYQPLKDAHAFYAKHGSGCFAMYKTTRAGTTTALIAASIQRGERFIHIIPNHKIGTETTCGTAIDYCGDHKPNIIPILPNARCLLNQKLIAAHPDLKILKQMPLRQPCHECEHFKVCPMTRILRERWDGITITTHKAIAINLVPMSPNAENVPLSKRIMMQTLLAKNIIGDESHLFALGHKVEMPLGKMVTSPVVGRGSIPKMPGKRDSDFDGLRNIVTACLKTLSDPTIQEKRAELLDEAEDRKQYWEKRLSATVPNPHRILVNSFDAADVLAKLVDLMIVRKDYGLTAREVAIIGDMLHIATSPQVSVSVVRDHEERTAKLIAMSRLFDNILGTYLNSLSRGDKRVLFTSATHGSFDYSNLIGRKVAPVFFGDRKQKGDPRATAKRMCIFPDTKGYSSVGRGDKGNTAKNLEIMAKDVGKIGSFAGGVDRLTIWTGSVRKKNELCRALEKYEVAEYDIADYIVDYYRSDDTMGKQGRGTVGVAFGIAHIPANAYDAYFDDKLKCDILRQELTDAATYQAWSRLKDPYGKVKSFIFARNCTEDQVRQACTWGKNRRLILNDDLGSLSKYTVETDISIPTPIIKNCNNLEEMFNAAKQF